jgi:predicted nucleic acid-binding protein
VLDFDSPSALAAADLTARLKTKGLGIDLRDAQIAGIVSTRSTTLATRNTMHFLNTGIKLVNPWEE